MHRLCRSKRRGSLQTAGVGVAFDRREPTVEGGENSRTFQPFLLRNPRVGRYFQMYHTGRWGAACVETGGGGCTGGRNCQEMNNVENGEG